MQGGAYFDATRVYRYSLFRRWQEDREARAVAFIMLNPSTADEVDFDPTVRRCYGYARSWGFNRLDVVNLYGLRATDPKQLLRVSDPIGPENDRWILKVAQSAALVVCAWGTFKQHAPRAAAVERMLRAAKVELYCLRQGKRGDPVHPLYQRGSLTPRVFEVKHENR